MSDTDPIQGIASASNKLKTLLNMLREIESCSDEDIIKMLGTIENLKEVSENEDNP